MLKYLNSFIQRRVAKEVGPLRTRIDELTREIARLKEEAVLKEDAVRRTDDSGRPQLSRLIRTLRDIDHMRWDIKVLGSVIGRSLLDANLERGTGSLAKAGLTSGLARQADFEQDWFRFCCSELKMAPLYHRKIWEDCFAVQALFDADMLQSGKKGLGFAVGAEALPAYFAARGVDVLATDLDANDERTRAWIDTNQHAAGAEHLFRPDMIDAETFHQRCRFQPVDMNQIDPQLHGQFDFCWSLCAFEHLGSIENGLKFVEESLRCLKPGGIAVHTSEFNLDPSGETVDNWSTVLFRQSDIDALAAKLTAAGHQVFPIDYSRGTGILDGFIDIPPYPSDPRTGLPLDELQHIKLSVDGFPTTSIGLIIRANPNV